MGASTMAHRRMLLFVFLRVESISQEFLCDIRSSDIIHGAADNITLVAVFDEDNMGDFR
jgi:hypothetical protein